MNIFGLTIVRTKSVPLPSTSSRGGWWPLIREPFTGAWQRNLEITTDSVLTFAAVYACVTLIASDIAKLRLRLVEQDTHGIWNETESAAFSPVLREPNHFQTRIQFFQQWMISKLIHGNTYVLKERDNRGVVMAMYVLDPTRVVPQVTPDGQIYYSLSSDNLAPISDSTTVVPAREIIHDVMVPIFHPLCGVSPITACGLAAVQGLRVQDHATHFFMNGARPGGILTTPGHLDVETAKTLQTLWETNYGGENSGKVAVVGNGLTYQEMGLMSAVDAQLIEQLRWAAENVCTAFRVPGYMVGVGPAPAYNNVQALTQQYYGQCLQAHIEAIESLLNRGLGLSDVSGKRLGTDFDLDDLLRMDTATQVKAGAEAIGSGGVAPNEARKRFFGLGPVTGGESPYLQQQNFSLHALSKRDASADPFGEAKTEAPAPSQAEPDGEAKHLTDWRLKSAAFGFEA